MIFLPAFALLLSFVGLSIQSCSSDLDCRLNGVCSSGSCVCDPGWTTDNCGALDIRPGPRNMGYNKTGEGTSSWGGKPIRDPTNPNLWHMFLAEMENGCTLAGWKPYSQVIRATSTNGPIGPYEKQQTIVSQFAHNPTVVWSEEEQSYLLYHIGCPQSPGDTCNTYDFQCSYGDLYYGESGISYRKSTDLMDWPDEGNYAFPGLNDNSWDADTTNPSAWPLQNNRYNIGGSHRCPGSTTLNTDVGSGVLMAYRGSPINATYIEQLGLASASSSGGPFTRLNNHEPLFNNQNEDPSIWRDKRGNWHIITHAFPPGSTYGGGPNFRGAPNLGGHAYSESIEGPWYFDTETAAYTTTVEFDDGTTVVMGERERPQLVFSDDGNMTPIVLTNGVVENLNTLASYTLAVPIGDYDNLWNTQNCY